MLVYDNIEIMIATIIVGVLIALMFLVSFSEWFYHVAAGIDSLLVKDLYVYYRLSLWIGGSLLFMAIVFWTLAMVKECPTLSEKKGVFRYLNCQAYWEVRGSLEGRNAESIKQEILRRQEEQKEEELEKWI